MKVEQGFDRDQVRCAICHLKGSSNALMQKRDNDDGFEHRICAMSVTKKSSKQRAQTLHLTSGGCCSLCGLGFFDEDPNI